MPGWRATSAVSACASAGTIASVVRSPARPRSSSSAARTKGSSMSERQRGERSWVRLRARRRRRAAARRGASLACRCRRRAAPGGASAGGIGVAGSRRANGRRGFPRAASAAVAIISADERGIGGAAARKASGCSARPPRRGRRRVAHARQGRADRMRSTGQDRAVGGSATGRGRPAPARRGRRRRFGDPACADHRLEQRVAGQAIGAVQAGGGRPRRRPTGPSTRAAALLRPRRCRPCGSAPPGRTGIGWRAGSMPAARQQRCDAGEAAREAGAERARAHRGRRDARRRCERPDGARDDVARLEFGAGHAPP